MLEKRYVELIRIDGQKFSVRGDTPHTLLNVLGRIRQEVEEAMDRVRQEAGL